MPLDHQKKGMGSCNLLGKGTEKYVKGKVQEGSAASRQRREGNGIFVELPIFE